MLVHYSNHFKMLSFIKSTRAVAIITLLAYYNLVYFLLTFHYDLISR
jgi:hypothetical protein